jgi:hypothetical protein
VTVNFVYKKIKFKNFYFCKHKNHSIRLPNKLKKRRRNEKQISRILFLGHVGAFICDIGSHFGSSKRESPPRQENFGLPFFAAYFITSGCGHSQSPIFKTRWLSFYFGGEATGQPSFEAQGQTGNQSGVPSAFPAF